MSRLVARRPLAMLALRISTPRLRHLRILWITSSITIEYLCTEECHVPVSLFYIPKIHNQATPDSQTGTGTHRQRTRAHRATTGTDTGSHTPLTAQTTNPPTTTQPSAVCYLPTYEPPKPLLPLLYCRLIRALLGWPCASSQHSTFLLAPLGSLPSAPTVAGDGGIGNTSVSRTDGRTHHNTRRHKGTRRTTMEAESATLSQSLRHIEMPNLCEMPRD